MPQDVNTNTFTGTAPPAQRQEHTGDETLDRVQAALNGLIAKLRLIPFLFGGKLVSVTFTASTRKVVRHGLGVPAACIVIRQNYGAGSASWRMAESATRAPDERQGLALVADADCTLDLWFYPRHSKSIDARSNQSL